MLGEDGEFGDGDDRVVGLSGHEVGSAFVELGEVGEHVGEVVVVGVGGFVDAAVLALDEAVH